MLVYQIYDCSFGLFSSNRQGIIIDVLKSYKDLIGMRFEMTYLENDTQDYVCSITPTEFEKFCLEVLNSFAQEEELIDFKIEHNVKMPAADSTYQIDVLASFSALGVTFKVLCECKQLSSAVERSQVEILNSRVTSLGYHKGILLATSGFQKDAIKFAKTHGIALIQVYDHSCRPVSHSPRPNAQVDRDDPFVFMEEKWPPYRAICFTAEHELPILLYPTDEIVESLYGEFDRLMKENK